MENIEIGKRYRLIIGESLKSYEAQSNNFYATLHYHFRPASIDSTHSSQLFIGHNGETTVEHVVSNADFPDENTILMKGIKTNISQNEFLLLNKGGDFVIENIGSCIVGLKPDRGDHVSIVGVKDRTKSLTKSLRKRENNSKPKTMKQVKIINAQESLEVEGGPLNDILVPKPKRRNKKTKLDGTSSSKASTNAIVNNDYLIQPPNVVQVSVPGITTKLTEQPI